MYSYSLTSGINNCQREHKIIQLKTSTLDSLKVTLYIKCGALKKYETSFPLKVKNLLVRINMFFGFFVEK